jgi:hypothetical protein
MLQYTEEERHERIMRAEAMSRQDIGHGVMKRVYNRDVCGGWQRYRIHSMPCQRIAVQWRPRTRLDRDRSTDHGTPSDACVVGISHTNLWNKFYTCRWAPVMAAFVPRWAVLATSTGRNLGGHFLTVGGTPRD